MPLQFRSFVPYTLPGVLALIGWWWYISRKKERVISHGSPEETTPTMGLTVSLTEGSNGVIEKDIVSPLADTPCPTHILSKHLYQRTEEETISYTHHLGTEASTETEALSEEDLPQVDRIIGEEVQNHSTPSPSSVTESLHTSLKVSDDLKEMPRSAVVLGPEKCMDPDQTSMSEPTVEAVALNYQSTKSTKVFTSPSTENLSSVERPEPEGEVSVHHSMIATTDEMVCTVSPAKAQSGIAQDAGPLETPPSTEGFHQHILTSTPTSPVLTVVQDFTTPSVTSADIQANTTHSEEQDLELLAAGLITEVISAATQEVLGVTSCQVAYNSLPSCSSSISQTNSKPCSQQDPSTTAQKCYIAPLSPLQLGNESHELQTTQKEEQGTPNGCSLVTVWETVEASQTPLSLKAEQGAPLLNKKLKSDEASTLAEDSACSSCHSDGISSEDLQNGILDNQTDVIQVTNVSAREPVVEAVTRATVEAIGEENSINTVCDIKRLTGIGQRNDAQGTCEVETDQSGGSDVNSMDSVDSGCTMGAGEGQSNHTAPSSSELIIWEIEVPKHLVGRLIGKQGRYVSFLKQTSGAKIYISTLPYTQEFQICHLEGTQQQVDKALLLIGKKFKDLDLANLYAPQPPPLSLPSLPMTSWLLLPSGVTVEVIVVNIVSAGHVFVQQHTHPTYHALRSLDQQMFMCYSQPGTPALPSPAEVGVICAAPAVEGAWWRAQVITFYKETNEVEIRYVDYGGYDRVKIDTLRQIR
ncbi:A kinase (PRKA) anchor protein 1b isoform X2 [Thalassophryne amazonica]|nr:A kinase (PRKA) anchor protein 1b isoform X2 [Thalassophryne amazonica]